MLVTHAVRGTRLTLPYVVPAFTRISPLDTVHISVCCFLCLLFQLSTFSYLVLPLQLILLPSRGCESRIVFVVFVVVIVAVLVIVTFVETVVMVILLFSLMLRWFLASSSPLLVLCFFFCQSTYMKNGYSTFRANPTKLEDEFVIQNWRMNLWYLNFISLASLLVSRLIKRRLIPWTYLAVKKYNLWNQSPWRLH